MKKFRIAWSRRKGTYEVHVDGCRHLISRDLEVMHGIYDDPTGQAVADRFARENDDCWATLGPCAR